MVEFLIYYKKAELAKLTLTYGAGIEPTRGAWGDLTLWFINNPPTTPMRQFLYYITTTPFGKNTLNLTNLAHSSTPTEPEKASYEMILFILNSLPENWTFYCSNRIEKFDESLPNRDYEELGLYIY